jgi:hypothetical protein
VRSAIGCASGLDEQAVQRLKDELTALRDRLDGRPG